MVLTSIYNDTVAGSSDMASSRVMRIDAENRQKVTMHILFISLFIYFLVLGCIIIYYGFIACLHTVHTCMDAINIINGSLI